jgi:hypothetical protein
MSQPRHPLRHAALLALVLPLAACANTNAMRTLATQTSGRITQQVTTLNGFVATGKQMNQDSLATVNALQGQAAAARAEVARQHSAWALAGNQDLVARAEVADQVQAQDILNALAAAHPTAPTLDDGGAGTSLTKAASAYTAMAKKPGFIDQATELFAIGQAVQKAAQTIEQNAAATPPPPSATTKPTATVAKAAS